MASWVEVKAGDPEGDAKITGRAELLDESRLPGVFRWFTHAR